MNENDTRDFLAGARMARRILKGEGVPTKSERKAERRLIEGRTRQEIGDKLDQIIAETGRALDEAQGRAMAERSLESRKTVEATRRPIGHHLGAIDEIRLPIGHRPGRLQ